MGPRLRLLVALLGLLFLLTHARTLPRTLEDMDSLNFALGVEQFDVSDHRPHPPGYPVYIALGKISTAALGAVLPSWDRDRRAASGLAVWGLLGGTLAAVVLTRFWLVLGFAKRSAFFATVLAVVSPLFWFTAARPLTDMPALVASIWIQSLLVAGLRSLQHAPERRVPRAWLWGAILAGLLIGLRSQTMWLTGPLLSWCAIELLRRHRWRDAAILPVAAAAGALLWAVPLVLLTGGLSNYLALLGGQGAADFLGVEMLATSPTWRLTRTILVRTFVWPWTDPLAYVLIAAALVGLIAGQRAKEEGHRADGKGQRSLLLLCFVPYLLFHMAFQESITVRYALPFVIPVAGLAAIGLARLRARLVTAAVVALVSAWSLVIAEPRLTAYSREGAAVFRGFQDMVQALPVKGDRPTLYMHHQVWWGVQRQLDWFRPVWDMGPQPFPGSREWLALVGEWRGGSTRPAWFLTDVSRTDIALFDWRSRTLRGHYALGQDVRTLMNGPRLEEMNWWEIRRPGWMLGTGWALTPEIAGMTVVDHLAPHEHPAEAYLRRQSSPMLVLVGGRYLAQAGAGGAVVSVDLDGRSVAEWPVTADHAWFTQWIDLPQGTDSGPGAYATLSVRVANADPSRIAPVIGLEQFDAAGEDGVITALSDGWHEPEEDPRTGRFWRWMSGRGTLTVRGGAHDVTLSIAGESPLTYFDRPPVVVVRAGAREVARFEPAGDFSREIPVTAEALAAALGQITIETSQTFVPAERGQGQDRRTLGLRLSRVDIR